MQRMSWFDTTGLASFAKSALKEAQKTLDKALDIKEDDVVDAQTNEDEGIGSNKPGEIFMDDTSVWGSFTGSYFDMNKTRKTEQVPNGVKSAPLATPETEMPLIESNPAVACVGDSVDESQKEGVVNVTGTPVAATDDLVKTRPKTQTKTLPKSGSNNRLSVASTESRKSSESVEILGSQSLATSPDSEMPSMSASSSIGLPSESVEVLDSLASPSSVEIIPDSSESLELQPEISSPGYSTDSVEVIEEDELSSMSESTATTMLLHRMTDSCQDLSQASSRLRSGASTPDVLKLSLPSHGSCDLLSESIQETDWESPETSQTVSLRSVQGSPIRRLLSKSEEKISKLESKSERLTQSDVASSLLCASSMSDSLSGGDSCGERTIIADEESKKADSSASSSLYMKELLAEAIGDESSTREPSPTLSEKSRSDAVKIGSEQTSGHTSGDELETTSSDIEVISRYSPNGDSSSTTSRHSPAKLLGNRQKLSLVAVDMLGRAIGGKQRGHQRQPSEASSGCSEDNSSEAEKLSKKILELTEVLEAREGKLVELSRTNLEVQEKNSLLKKQLEAYQTDSLSEKDELIRELREEGEKLSKFQLKQSNVIKTLRKQEQSQQNTIANYKKQIESQTQETETLKTKLIAKEEIEKSQTDKISLLTGKIGRQDREIATLMDQLEQAVVKAEQLRINLDAVQSELDAKKLAIMTLERELHETSQTAESAKKDRERMRERERERDSMVNQIEQLRLQIKEAEQLNFQKETQAREEKKNLLRRLEVAEGKNEELAQSISASTRPLLRQLEQLQLNANQQRTSWEQREKQLLDQLEETMAQQHLAKESEKAAKQEASNLRGRLASLEAQTQRAVDDAAKLKTAQDELEKQCNCLKIENARILDTFSKQVEELRGKLSSLQKDLSVAEAAAAAANQRAAHLEKSRESERPSPPPLSPALSFGHVSISESESWPQFADDAFETGSISGRNLYDSVRGGSSTLLEGLQAQLKMREGEALQLQWEMQRRDAERSALTAELTSLTARLAERDEALAQAKRTENALAELKSNYDALLQMHGEKVEEVEELRLDLQDVKEMYKAQIDQLLQRNSREEPPG